MSNSLKEDNLNTIQPTKLLWEFSTIFASLFRRVTKIDWLVRIVTLVIPTLFLVSVVFQPWVEPKWMFLDPLTAAELSGDCCHTHYGFVSMLGVMLWVAIASIAAFVAIQLIATGRSGAVLLFAITATLFNGWLALDDAFLLHETVLPSFGVPQNLVLAAYIFFALAYIISNRTVMLAGDIWLLAMGGLALVASLAVDTLFHSLDPFLVLLEDSAKFFGIFCWTAFHVSTLVKISIAEIRQDEMEAR